MRQEPALRDGPVSLRLPLAQATSYGLEISASRWFTSGVDEASSGGLLTGDCQRAVPPPVHCFVTVKRFL